MNNMAIVLDISGNKILELEGEVPSCENAFIDKTLRFSIAGTSALEWIEALYDIILMKK